MIRPLFRRLLPCLLFPLALAACGPAQDTRPGQPVKHRQDAFKQLLRAFEPYGVMLRTNEYDAKQMAQFHDPFAASLNGPWGYFGAGTNYPPSKAKAALWERPAEFAKDKEAFMDGARALLAAKTKEEAKAAYERTREACNTCHKAFRQAW
jgi:cytochrome c556